MKLNAFVDRPLMNVGSIIECEVGGELIFFHLGILLLSFFFFSIFSLPSVVSIGALPPAPHYKCMVVLRNSHVCYPQMPPAPKVNSRLSAPHVNEA